MKRKKQLRQFLEENCCMINGCMSLEDRKMFKDDIVGYIIRNIDRQIKKEEKESNNDKN